MKNSPEDRYQFLREETFATRHIGCDENEQREMANMVGFDSSASLARAAVPNDIFDDSPSGLPQPLSEWQAQQKLKTIANKNQLFRSFIGTGYYDTITPPVIQRCILENPGWYTQYTPYQAEIAQGRLEALINFQTAVSELTKLPIANASLLDEATACAEAICVGLPRSSKSGNTRPKVFVDQNCHPQNIAVIKTRMEYLEVDLIIDSVDVLLRPEESDFDVALIQYPGTDGEIKKAANAIKSASKTPCCVVAVADLLALTLLSAPGELGADIAVGSCQRFGVPLGYGGPHAAYISIKNGMERRLPGRLVGVSKDKHGDRALRLALATREQHIRRDKATSNICTSQVLLAVMAGAYAVYHGPHGLRQIARRVHGFSRVAYSALLQSGFRVTHNHFFDTIIVETGKLTTDILERSLEKKINLRVFADEERLGFSLDEKTNEQELLDLLSIFDIHLCLSDVEISDEANLPSDFLRTDEYLAQDVFHRYHSEASFTRYIKSLENKDLSLTHSMIPLGSCTMKLNSVSELQPVSWPEFNNLHPFAPIEQATGYQELFGNLEQWLAKITGFHAVSLQPNSGAQGEYAGLLVIRAYQKNRGEQHRNICLIPTSAHGTNPASAVMCGMKIVGVKCNSDGDVDLEDLRAKAEKHASNLSALMITYPSTHGVFESAIREICDTVHQFGGQVYMDGANLQAQIGTCKAGEFGPDVCHMNLHKTFCIPHGGGGPGMGPIAVAQHLAPFLPGHPNHEGSGGLQSGKIGPVSAAPWGSASILPISWMYIQMMGDTGLKSATQVAILNANYMASRLKDSYSVVFKGQNDLVAHECIIDLKPFKKTSGITEMHVAKRLMDYGFHAPTVSWPVVGSLMIEPTESESREEIDRYCDALIKIREEIQLIEDGVYPKDNNPLVNAPHTAKVTTCDSWDYPYSRETAAYPMEFLKQNKFWPSVGRIDDAYGDRHLVCSCTIEIPPS